MNECSRVTCGHGCVVCLVEGRFCQQQLVTPRVSHVLPTLLLPYTPARGVRVIDPRLSPQTTHTLLRLSFCPFVLYYL